MFTSAPAPKVFLPAANNTGVVSGMNTLATRMITGAYAGIKTESTAPLHEGTKPAKQAGRNSPTEESKTPKKSNVHDTPDAHTLAALVMTPSQTLLTIESTPLLRMETVRASQLPEQSLQLVSGAGTPSLSTEIQFSPTVTIADAAPVLRNPEPTLEDGRGEFAAFADLLPAEGDAPPVSARQAELPPPPTFPDAPVGATGAGNTLRGVSLTPPPSETVAPPQKPTPPRDELPPTPPKPSVNAGAAPTLTPGNPTPSVDNTVQPQPTASLWGVAEQVAQHIERLVYERERNSLTVRLDPPELGVVELRFQATGGEVQAWLSAERDLTRQLLQQAQQYLREQLESRGLQLTHFDVGAQRSFQHAPYEQSRSDATAISLARTAATINNFVYDGRWSIWV